MLLGPIALRDFARAAMLHYVDSSGDPMATTMRYEREMIGDL
ncbi:MAG: hypothetical protein ABI277_01595 [Burkholderiaceae bacterium]